MKTIFTLLLVVLLPAQAHALDPGQPAAVMTKVTAKAAPPPRPLFDPRTYGAKADGATYDTAALQKAIDACAGTGGSVYLAGGRFLTAELVLKGGMTLYIEKDSVLLGGIEAADYPEHMPVKTAASANRRSLLFADHADHLVLDGDGVIDGQGKLVKMTGREPFRPSILRIFSSKDVTVRNLTIKNPRMWTQVYSECERLLIDHVTVLAPPVYENLDGMDICDSRDVVIRNCYVDSEDDSICLKSHGARGLQNILVENNTILCRRANAIKLGTATTGPISGLRILNNTVLSAQYGGLCIESVDGSAVSDVLVRGLDLMNTAQPIFIRLARRHVNAPASGLPAAGLSGVTIERVRALGTHTRTRGSSTISGIPGMRVKDVVIRDCYFEMPGGLTSATKTAGEKETDYPQSNLFGNPPGWAFYVRHADGVVFENVTVALRKPDARPWLASEDADVKTTSCHDLSSAPAAPPKS
jgi:polygalacturonase